VLYNLDPQYVVTFNRKDYLRYQRLYPSIMIYFWLDWHVREMVIGRSIFAIAPLAGVWRAPFAQLAGLIEHSNTPLHAYQRRQGDTQGNAKESYLVDVRALQCLYQH